MKSTGIVRKLDQLGRIVLPMELRKTHDITEKDSLEIFVDGDNLILRKYTPGCIICGSLHNVIDVKSKWLCEDCINSAKEKVG